MDSDIAKTRKQFANELKSLNLLQSDRLVEAFSTVPRKHFAGSPPWEIRLETNFDKIVPTSDPKALYQNALISLDSDKGINNGAPGIISLGYDALELKEESTICQIGTGGGYYTAILAKIVGPTGQVWGIEIDLNQFERSKANLTSYSNVKLINEDGASFIPESVDAIFSHAGASYPQKCWLNNLKPNGVLVFPLTYRNDDSGGTWGKLIKIKHFAGRYKVSVISNAGFYPCIGGRDPFWDKKLGAISKDGFDEKLSAEIEVWANNDC